MTDQKMGDKMGNGSAERPFTLVSTSPDVEGAGQASASDVVPNNTTETLADYRDSRGRWLPGKPGGPGRGNRTPPPGPAAEGEGDKPLDLLGAFRAALTAYGPERFCRELLQKSPVSAAQLLANLQNLSTNLDPGRGDGVVVVFGGLPHPALPDDNDGAQASQAEPPPAGSSPRLAPPDSGPAGLPEPDGLPGLPLPGGSGGLGDDPADGPAAPGSLNLAYPGEPSEYPGDAGPSIARCIRLDDD